MVKNIIFEKIDVNFEQHLWNNFTERVTESNNIKTIKMLYLYDKYIGVKCNDCTKVLPLYCFGQDATCKYGLLFTRCLKCNVKKACVFRTLMSHAKTRSRVRHHKPPDFDCEWIKDKLEQQNGKCAITGIMLRLKHGDNDPFNISLERLSNKVHYTKDNVVLICQWLQLGKGGVTCPQKK